jgi:hypothetical protein
MKYEEYLVTDKSGNVHGYRNTYEEALSLASMHEAPTIYGKRWMKSKIAGLLHLDWEKVKEEAQ